MKLEALKEEARRHELREEWAKALELYQRAIERRGEDDDPEISLHNRVGDLQVRLGDVRAAIASYETAIDLYVDAGLPNNAIAVCRKVIRHDPRRPDPFLRMGRIHAERGFLVDARQNFLLYAEMLEGRGKVEEALAALEEFAKAAPNDAEVRELLASQLQARDRSEDAVHHLVQAWRIRTGAGDAERAEALLERIRTIDPDHPEPSLQAPRSEASASADGGASAVDALEGFESTALEEGPSGDAEVEGAIEPASDLLLEASLEEEEERTASIDTSGFVLDVREDDDAEGEADADSGVQAILEGAEEGRAASDRADLGLEPPGFAGDAFESEGHEGPAEASERPEDEPPELREVVLDSDDGVAAPGEFAMAEPERLSELEAPGSEGEAAADEPREALVSPEEAFPLAAEASEEPEEDDSPLPYLTAGDDDLSLPAEGGGELPLLEAGEEETAFDLPEGAGADEAADDDRLSFSEELRDAGLPNEGSLLEDEGATVPMEDVTAFEGHGVPVEGSDADRMESAEAIAESEEVPGSDEGSAGPSGEGEREYVDLGALVLDDDLRPGTTRWTVQADAPTADEDADFRKMLSQFKEKVARNLDADDAQANYDLGAAYKEMGLIEEAIGQFQQALRARPGWLAALEMLGQCFLERGEPGAAIRTLERALRFDVAVEDELLGIYYALGTAHEALGNTGPAREFYERIFALDINFMDVTDRLRTLR